jgi:hypothetical protein
VYGSEEVIRMPTETLPENGRVTVEPESIFVGRRDDETLRAQAKEQLKRIRDFKIHFAVYALGVPLLGVAWMITEYIDAGRWPTRFADADNGVVGTWNPWFFYAAGIWTIFLLIHGFKTYATTRMFRHPTEAEVDREVQRLKSPR